jgi:hypothetical protein
MREEKNDRHMKPRESPPGGRQGFGSPFPLAPFRFLALLGLGIAEVFALWADLRPDL